MKNVYHVPVMRPGRQRQFVAILTMLLLSFIVAGCGADGPDTSRLESAAARVTTAFERSEAAAGKVETATQKMEAARGRINAAAEEIAAFSASAETIEAPAADAETDTATTAEPLTETEVNAPDGNPIKVGVIATLEGVYAAAGDEALRGVEMALAEFDYQINGRPIETLVESSDIATPDVALRAAQKLINEDQVDLILGPLAGDEGLLIRELAKDYPNKTFINGNSAAQDITLRDPAPNFFRFNMDGVQWMAGLGTYAYEQRGYQRVVTLASDYSFAYGQVGGFLIDYCQAGGEVVEKYWVPLGTTDYSGIISTMRDDIDAIYVGLAGTDSVSFIKQFAQLSAPIPIIASSSTLDQANLSTEDEFADYILGTVTAGPIAVDNPDDAWQEFVVRYRQMFPDGLPSPSTPAHSYYLNAKAMLLALDAVHGDLSDGQQAFQTTLANLEFNSPTGPVRLDENRQAIGTNFITEMVQDENGTIFKKFVQEVPNASQTLGLDREAYLGLGVLSRSNPLCEDVQGLIASQ